MAPRPAKRQRRSTLVSPGPEEDEDTATRVPLRTSTRLNAPLKNQKPSTQTTPPKSKAKTTKAAKTTTTPQSSPEKTRKKQDTVQSKSLHTFFSRATEEERWQRKADTPEQEIEGEDPADAIEDDESSEEASRTSRSGSFNAGRTTHDIKPIKVESNVLASKDLSSQPSRFVKPPLPRKVLPTSTVTHDTTHDRSRLPWSERYGPENLEELAVHKKKVADVQKWLTDALKGLHGQRLLVLKGPAGSGKTTALSLICKSMGVEIASWHNPTVSESGLTTSVALQFDDFLNRGGLFGGLIFDDNSQSNKPILNSRRILLVEEFPITMTRSSAALDSFRSVLLSYLSANSQLQPVNLGGQTAEQSVPPAVLIISETLLSSSTALSDSFTAHRLLGPDLTNHPLAAMIDFNPIAHTFITRALDLIIKKEARDSRRRRVPGPAVLERLAQTGDIRSAVTSLEFLCVRAEHDSNWSGTVAAKGKKGGKDGVPLTEMEEESLRLVSQRESTLDMFHAAGKIVYNKREDPRVLDTRAEPPPKPPDHLMYLYNPKVSQVDIEALLNETGTDIQTFISTLHENYVLSCNGHDFADWVDGCAEFLSDADILCPDSRTFGRRSDGSRIQQSLMQSGSSETLRQDEISFQVATRGLLFSLPYPVNRAAAVTGRKADAFKMFYPASLRLWKPTEEIDSLLAMFVHPSSTSGQSNHESSSNTGVASWKSKAAEFSHPGVESRTSDESEEETLIRSYVSKDDLVLEVLPYQAKIKSARKEDTAMLSKITRFDGITVPANDEPLDEEVEQGAFVVGTMSVESSLRQPQKPVDASGDRQTMKVQEEKMDKLYISDDDIQDD